jgi:hypothetical protein
MLTAGSSLAGHRRQASSIDQLPKILAQPEAPIADRGDEATGIDGKTAFASC